MEKLGVNCYNCLSTDYKNFAEENGFYLVKCENCGLLFVKNRPSDNDILEASKQGMHYGSKELDVTGFFDENKISEYLIVLENLFRNNKITPDSWLDVGCGYGEFLIAVKKFHGNNITVIGTEPNVYKMKWAKEKGLDVDYFDIEDHLKNYSVISLLNVYSHLPNPVEFLKNIKKILKTNGELIIETGDITDYTPENLPRPLYLPDHLSFATEKILVKILKELDFEILSINKYPIMEKNVKVFFKELIKFMLPNYTSRINYFFTGVPKTDMFIRAKLRR